MGQKQKDENLLFLLVCMGDFRKMASKFKNFARKIIAPVLVPLMLLAGNIRNARASSETIKLFSTELSYTRGRKVVKFRPFISTEPTGEQRTDLMLGRKFKPFTLYAYFKSDNMDRSWIGPRVDYTFKSLDDKLTTNLQFRYFKGLNDLSKDHFYFIPTIDYKLNDRLKVGMLGYAKKDDGRKPSFYLGPSFTVNLTKNLSALLSYDIDVLGNYDADMIFLSLQYKF